MGSTACGIVRRSAVKKKVQLMTWTHWVAKSCAQTPPGYRFWEEPSLDSPTMVVASTAAMPMSYARIHPVRNRAPLILVISSRGPRARMALLTVSEVNTVIRRMPTVKTPTAGVHCEMGVRFTAVLLTGATNSELFPFLMHATVLVTLVRARWR